ncbi:hypothetical protein F511_19284 [Dorcoceras hygrometricum]|uniref:Uncharacterized protein n=1 Tax=Dorcoceras hygrometricum TaxID=472368 RepID=A0A2Z7A8W0_9LAMI|nr:hypothetical protein F511_19284 [Dorcoceras hygrometricum]
MGQIWVGMLGERLGSLYRGLMVIKARGQIWLSQIILVTLVESPARVAKRRRLGETRFEQKEGDGGGISSLEHIMANFLTAKAGSSDAVTAEQFEAKRQIGDTEKLVAKRKLKAHEDSRAEELKKKWIGKRKTTARGEAITTKRPTEALASSVVAVHPFAGSDGGAQHMVVENSHLEDLVTEVIVDSDPNAKGKEIFGGFGKAEPVEEHCTEALKDIGERVDPWVSKFDQWKEFRTEVRMNTISLMTVVANMDKIEDDLMTRAETERQFTKLFYRKLDDLLVSMNRAQTSMESRIGRDMHENHQRLSNEVTILSSQVAEVVPCLKEMGDAKKGEISQKRR